jgi:putative transcriptional regulator
VTVNRAVAVVAMLILGGVAAPSARVAGAPPVRSLAGDLLVASTEMRDPRFARTVIYMIRHDGQGAQGLVINRPLGDLPLARLLERLRMESAGATGMVRLHAGGPVESGNLIVLHTSDYAGEHTTPVKHGISVTAQRDVIRAMALGKGPRRSLVVLGHAGWAPGQLEAEIDAGAWLLASADEGMLFDPDYETMWERARARRKIDL